MPEGLARRVGPLPVWGWIVVGLAAYLVWRRRTEGGWFPGVSYPVVGGGGEALVGVRSFLGFGSGGGVEPESEPMFVGVSSGEPTRPELPAPITDSGGALPTGTPNYPKTPGGTPTPISPPNPSPYTGGHWGGGRR